jgi:hypothetical protein
MQNKNGKVTKYTFSSPPRIQHNGLQNMFLEPQNH